MDDTGPDEPKAVPPPKKSLLQRLREIYTGRKKKTLHGKRRWFEIFRRKKRNDTEANASLKEREIQNVKSLNQEELHIGQAEENQKDEPDQKSMTEEHGCTGCIRFRFFRKKKSVKSYCSKPADSEEMAKSSASEDMMAEVSKPLHGYFKDRDDVPVIATGKTPVAHRKSAKIRRSCVPDTTTVTTDESSSEEERILNIAEIELPEFEKVTTDESSSEEERILNIEKIELPELQKVTTDESSFEEERILNIEELELPELEQFAMVDMPSVEQASKFDELQPHSKKEDDVLEGLDQLLDDLENFENEKCKESSVAVRSRSSKYAYTDDVLDGLDELMDDVYYDR